MGLSFGLSLNVFGDCRNIFRNFGKGLGNWRNWVRNNGKVFESVIFITATINQKLYRGGSMEIPASGRSLKRNS